MEAGRAREFARAHQELLPSRRRHGWFRWCRLSNSSTYLRWTGSFEFLISADGRHIFYRRLGPASEESLSIYLLGQVLSFSLLALGIESLHGTVVVVGGEGVAFLGDCGYGKSTLAAALLTGGYRILTDDVMVLEEKETRWIVHPGIPRLKLFPSVARKVLGSDLHGGAMNPHTSKLVLPLSASQSVRRGVPLKALYVLSNPRRCRRKGLAPVQIEHLSGRDAFLEVIRAAFNILVFERGRLANQFQFANRLVATVPVRRVHYARDLSLLPSVCDAILADAAGNSAPARADADAMPPIAHSSPSLIPAAARPPRDISARAR